MYIPVFYYIKYKFDLGADDSPSPQKFKDHVKLEGKKNLCNHPNYITDFAILRSCFYGTSNKKWMRMFRMKFRSHQSFKKTR